MMMHSQPINTRLYTTLLPSEATQLQADKNYLFDLSYLSLLEVDGTRASDFLQGQLSCDVRQVTSTNMQQGALCNLKGRVMGLFDVIYWQNYRLILPTDLLSATKTSLANVAMVSRVSLHDVNDYACYGFYLGNKDDLLPGNLALPAEKYAVTTNENRLCYNTGDNYYIVVTPKHTSPELEQPFADAHQLYGSLAWHNMQLQRLHVEIYPETRGLFLPHRLNLPTLGFINFEKGCYKGQEIIARMHYRAKQKYALKKFMIHTCEPLTAGAKLFDAENSREIGELIDVCPAGAGGYLIVVSLLHEHSLTVMIEHHTSAIHL